MLLAWSRRVLALSTLSLAAAVMVGACKDEGSVTGDGDAGSADDGGDSDGGTGDTPRADGGACSDLVNAAPLVDTQLVFGDPPAATGGRIESGTYFMTALIYHFPTAEQGSDAGAPNSKWRETFRIEVTLGTSINRVFAPGGGPDRYVNFAIEDQSATTVTFATSCGEQDTLTVPYTATSTDIVLYVPTDNGRWREQRFKRQK